MTTRQTSGKAERSREGNDVSERKTKRPAKPSGPERATTCQEEDHPRGKGRCNADDQRRSTEEAQPDSGKHNQGSAKRPEIRMAMNIRHGRHHQAIASSCRAHDEN